MKNLYRLVLLIGIASVCSQCSSNYRMNKHFGAGIYNTWYHSHEEDESAKMNFRPKSYPLGPSRGRVAIEIMQGGKARISDIGPTDLPQRSEGEWKLKKKNQLIITTETGESKYIIHHFSDDHLLLEKI
jgi:hypothetical protein